MPLDPQTDVEVKPGIVLSVLVDGYRHGIGADNAPWRWVRYLAPGAQGASACDALKGVGAYTGTIGTAGSATISFPNPHKYPHNENLVCLEAEAEYVGNVGPDDQLVTGDFAIIQAKYGYVHSDVFGTDTANAFGGESGPWMSFENRGYIEEHPVSGRDLSFTDATVTSVPDGRMVARVPVIEKIVERLYVPFLYDDVLEEYMGCVNDRPMWGRPKGVILFETFATRRRANTDGTTMQEYSLVFKRRKYAWNAQLVPGMARTWKEVADELGQKTYEEKNLYDVLIYAAPV